MNDLLNDSKITADKFPMLACGREAFDIPADITYLNCASQSPQLHAVTAAGLDSVRSKAAPWKIASSDWFTGAEALREAAARIIGVKQGSIALVPSVSYGMAIAAANVPVKRGQTIILLHDEFPSNYYTWQKAAGERGAQLKIVQRRDGESWAEAVVDALDEQTAVVSVPNCHWTDGSLVDLEKVGEKARTVGAALVVDASQSLGAYPLDIAKVQPDFLVAVGYKWLLGPYALGYLYIAPKWQAKGQPIENSWLNRQGAEDFSGLTAYTDEYAGGARRFDMGEFPNFVLVPMALAALAQVNEWQVERIGQTLDIITDLIAAEATRLGFSVPPERVSHFIGIRFPGALPATLTEELAKAKIYVSLRGNSLRIAPHIYNDEQSIKKLFTVLQKFA